MIFPILTYVFDRKHTATSKKEASVELRIAYNGKSKYIATGIKLLPKHWKNGTVVNRIDAQDINDALGIMMSNVRKVINDMAEESELNTAEIKSRLKRMLADERSFLEFIEERTKIRMYGKKDDTAKRYDRFLRWLRQWGKIMFFSDITDQNIIAMDEELKATGMKDYSKWINYHRFMNSFINDAINDGLIRRNPYRWLHINKEQDCGIQKYLTPEELEALATANMPTESLERVRDLFVFQSYTCMSYVDMQNFDIKKVRKTKSGVYIYSGRRGKTGQEFTFVLLEMARGILDKYGGVLPLISNVKYNAYIKVVAQYAGIDKPLTTHWARHTGATMLLNAGVDMEIVAKVLGHSSTKQTRQTYAKLLDDTIAKEMSKLDDKKSAPQKERTTNI